MSLEKKEEKKEGEEGRLHIRNKNRERYDLEALISVNAELEKHIKRNKFGVKSLDFANPIAVKLLNEALLNHYYGIKFWEFPDDNLCPPVPGRADYIHYVADLLSKNNRNIIPIGDKVTCLDVGVGASCIYPIIGVIEYKWNFIGAEVDPKSVKFARNIANSNSLLEGKIDCLLQKDTKHFFTGIIDRTDKIDVTICNPPFHASLEEAQKSTRRKVKNLTKKNPKEPKRNFAGIQNELVYEGGEYQFIYDMIQESKQFAKNCCWFTTLVSKQSNLKGIYKTLKALDVNNIETISMGTGNKSSRIVAWTFLSRREQKEWGKARWKIEEDKPGHYVE